MSTIAEITEAVKDAINAASDSSFVVAAERVYVPLKEFKDFTSTTPVVFVFPRTSERANEWRKGFKSEIEIHIWYAMKLTGTTQPNDEAAMPDLDLMLDFAETLSEVIKPGTEYADVPCTRIEHDPIYDFETLSSHRVFVGVVKAFFRRWTST